MIPLTNYQVGRISFYTKRILILFTVIFLAGNCIYAVFSNSITVSESAYTIKEGIPFFHSEKEYIKLVRNYPRNPGVKLLIHSMRKGESFWDITTRYKIKIDTLIAANPFLSSLLAEEGKEIVVPLKDGVLLPFDDILDVWGMKKRLNFKGKIEGDYKPGFFSIISTDDIRLVFYPDAAPVLVNSSLEKLYRLKMIFQTPVSGRYTSLFGDRVDPFFHEMEFHNGVDIQARTGTPIHPVREGIVISAGWRQGYGKSILVQHDEGYLSLYAHCSKILVKKGDWIKKKDAIGLIGSTGRSTGPHLHFTIWRHGKIINPLLLIW